jgi:hypothetical protein
VRSRLARAGRIGRLAAAATVAVLLSAGSAQAQEPAGAGKPAQPREEPEGEFPNEIAAIVAGTWEHQEDETFFTLGLEYERRLTPRVGIVGELEFLFDADRWIVAAPVVFRPARGVKLFAGPGFERAEAVAEEGEGEPLEESGRETRFLLRFGAGYAVEFRERYSVTPMLSIDFVRERSEWGRAVVFGATFGIAF